MQQYRHKTIKKFLNNETIFCYISYVPRWRNADSQRLHFVKNFAFMFLQSWSTILYARPVAVTGAWTKLHLLSQPSRHHFLGQGKLLWRKLIFKSCSTLSTSLTTPIYHFLSYLHATFVQTQRLCGHPTKTCLSG